MRQHVGLWWYLGGGFPGRPTFCGAGPPSSGPPGTNAKEVSQLEARLTSTPRTPIIGSEAYACLRGSHGLNSGVVCVGDMKLDPCTVGPLTPVDQPSIFPGLSCLLRERSKHGYCSTSLPTPTPFDLRTKTRARARQPSRLPPPLLVSRNPAPHLEYAMPNRQRRFGSPGPRAVPSTSISRHKPRWISSNVIRKAPGGVGSREKLGDIRSRT